MKRLKRMTAMSFILFSCVSCSIHLNPHEFDGQKTPALPVLQNTMPVALRAVLTHSGEKELPIAGASVFVNEDQFAEVLVERIKTVLKRQGVPVESAAERALEIQIAQVALQPTARIHCVIDFNRRLGKGEFYGFQSRGSGNPESACDEALDNAVSEILSDPDAIGYLKGD